MSSYKSPGTYTGSFTSTSYYHNVMNYIPKTYTTTGNMCVIPTSLHAMNNTYYIYSKKGEIQNVLTEKDYNDLVNEGKIKEIKKETLPEIKLINL